MSWDTFNKNNCRRDYADDNEDCELKMAITNKPCANDSNFQALDGGNALSSDYETLLAN